MVASGNLLMILPEDSFGFPFPGSMAGQRRATCATLPDIGRPSVVSAGNGQGQLAVNHWFEKTFI